jgi:hypothetical protein
MSGWFFGIYPGRDLQSRFENNSYWNPEVLQRLESHGVIWIVRKGLEIEYLELRLPKSD